MAQPVRRPGIPPVAHWSPGQGRAPIPLSNSVDSSPGTKKRLAEHENSSGAPFTNVLRHIGNAQATNLTRLDRVCKELRSIGVLYHIFNESCKAAAMSYASSDSELGRHTPNLVDRSPSTTELGSLLGELSVAPHSPLVESIETEDGVRTNDGVPVRKGPDEVYGHEEFLGALKDMTASRTSEGLSDLYLKSAPEKNTIYVVSTPGSGTRSAVAAFCQRNSINLLRLTLGIDLYWRDKEGVFGTVMDAASLLKPCIVFIDRCDRWFSMSDGYGFRGEKLFLYSKVSPAVFKPGSGVYLVYSAVEGMAALHPNIVAMFRDGYTIQTLVGARDLARFIRSKLTEYFDEVDAKIRTLQESAMTEAPPQFLGLGNKSAIEKAIGETSEQLAGILGPYTPRMAQTFLQEVFRTVRTAALRGRNAHSVLDSKTKIELLRMLIPGEDAFQEVLKRVSSTDPGVILWKTDTPEDFPRPD